MDRSLARLLPAFAAISLGLQGCRMASSRPDGTATMGLHLDEKEMKAEVLRYVPVGMPIDEAKKVMEANGFKCRYDENWRDWWMNTDPEKQGEMYLICSRYKPQERWWHNFVMSDEIRVFIAFEDDGKVQNIRVEHISSCL